MRKFQETASFCLQAKSAITLIQYTKCHDSLLIYFDCQARVIEGKLDGFAEEQSISTVVDVIDVELHLDIASPLVLEDMAGDHSLSRE